MALGEDRLADRTMVNAVLDMQDFRADGVFRASIGVESAKEWKGEPYEKMMAFLYLGLLRYQEGDYSNALAMTKSAILADTGTDSSQYRADFVPAFVLQSLAFQGLHEDNNAERSMEQAIDALWNRALNEQLSKQLNLVQSPQQSQQDVDAAKILLLAGLPAGLGQHPRDPEQAIRGALSWASDARRVALKSSKKNWPEGLAGLSKGDLRKAFDQLEPITVLWKSRLDEIDQNVLAGVEKDESFYRGLLDEPSLLLWVESGWGPQKIAEGRYGEMLRIIPRELGHMPEVSLDGQDLAPHFIDSVTFQAQTRGGRPVDGFLKGKAVFKDSAGLLGFALLEAGDVANYVAEDDTAATILYLAGAAVWIAGAITNPRADTRYWDTLPDRLWLVRADPSPGAHKLVIDGNLYTVQIPDRGRVSRLIPMLTPGGPTEFGEPCIRCELRLAIPDGGPQ